VKRGKEINLFFTSAKASVSESKNLRSSPLFAAARVAEEENEVLFALKI